MWERDDNSLIFGPEDTVGDSSAPAREKERVDTGASGVQEEQFKRPVEPRPVEPRPVEPTGRIKRGFFLMRGRADTAVQPRELQPEVLASGLDSTALKTDPRLPTGENLPRHVAVIMDGNGRWAQERQIPRFEGHRVGAKNVRGIVEECRRLGIRYLTLFTFSTENWNRPRAEVASLMKLFKQYLDSELQSLLKNNVRLRAIGDLSRLPAAVCDTLERNAEMTKHHDGLDLILAISYGGREEIVAATKQVAMRVELGELRADEVSEADLRSALYAPDVPDPDLLIRTSGENRISNFLLWQIAYTEIHVSPVYWPDFTTDEFHRSLSSYAARVRRFGLTGEQLAADPLKRDQICTGQANAARNI